MIKRYTSFAKNILADVKETDLVKLAIYTSVAAASSIWPVIALKDAGYGTSQVLTIFAFENWLGMLLLLFFSVFLHKKNVLKNIWLSVTWAAAIGWFLLAFIGFELSSPLSMVVLFITVITSHMAAVCLFADTLDQVQEGEAGAIKLALFFLLVPVCKITFISLGGFLAEYSFVYVALFLGFSLLLSNLIWHDHIVLHTVSAASTKKLWHAFGDKKRLMLMFLSGFFNALNVPVRFVFVPLYFYEKTGGSPSKVGLALAMLGVVALLGHAAKNYMKGTNVNTFNFMVWGLAGYILVPLIWYLGYDHVWVVGAALIFGQVVNTIWSYGFFAEFRKVSDDSPTICTQQWQVFISFFIGVSCIILSFITDDLMQYIQVYLLSQFVFLASFLVCFLFWWRRQ